MKTILAAYPGVLKGKRCAPMKKCTVCMQTSNIIFPERFLEMHPLHDIPNPIVLTFNSFS